jgi:signal transduction histidine kinase
MKRLIPRSIGARTVVVLLAGLLISHVLSVAIYYGDRASALTFIGGGHIAERIATITRLLEQTPTDNRPQLIGIINGPTLRLSWNNAALYDKGPPGGWRTRLMHEVLRDHLGGTEEKKILVSYADEVVRGQSSHAGTTPRKSDILGGGAGTYKKTATGEITADPAFLVSIQLTDSTWLNYVLPVTEQQPFLSLRFFLSLAVMAATVIILGIWAMRRVTSPLATFAQAAERLGVDVNAPPVAETGPREVLQATQAFNQMQQRLRRFLNDRTQMLAAISHDLRTPITRLRLRAEFVEDEAQQTKMMHDLEEMESMISSVLSFAQDNTTGEPRKPIDLAALLESICDDLADSGEPVELDAEPRLPYNGQPMALKRAFTNLIENAIKYGSRARVQLREEQDRITVEINDDGPGILESEQEKVFAPFYRIERSRSRDTGGTGLGLAFTRTIIRAHGGDVRLANRTDGGLRVVVTLPR